MDNLLLASRKLDVIIKSAQVILEKKSFNESARTIFDYCCEITGAVSGYVALLSDDGEENEVLFLEAGGMNCTVNPELPMPIRGLRSIVYNSNKAAYENDFMNSKWISFMPEGHVLLRNVMFAPLVIDNKTVGIIGLANKPVDFTDDDAEIASALGKLAAIALMNSRYIDLLKVRTEELEKTLSEIKTLKGIIPICSHCKEIRDDKGSWNQLERYISRNSYAQFSHGICDKCLKKYHPEDADEIIEETRNL